MRTAGLVPAPRLYDGVAPVCARRYVGAAALASRACLGDQARRLRAEARGGRSRRTVAAFAAGWRPKLRRPGPASAMGRHPAWRPRNSTGDLNGNGQAMAVLLADGPPGDRC
jgi:hypothetical protein